MWDGPSALDLIRAIVLARCAGLVWFAPSALISRASKQGFRRLSVALKPTGLRR
jgi:hypothetical protein